VLEDRLAVDDEEVVDDMLLLKEEEVLEDVLRDEDVVDNVLILEDDEEDKVEDELLLVAVWVVPPVLAEFTKLTKELQSTPSFLYVAGSSVRYIDPYPVETSFVTNVLKVVPVVGME